MDIVAMGEILIDLTQVGLDGAGIPQFAANPGGAPANLAVAAAKLGARTAFVGRTGADAFGQFLKATLETYGVDVSGLSQDAHHPTTLAVVSVDASGERDFSFYRDRSADVMLTKEAVPAALLENTHFFHIGSVSLTAEPARSATLQCAQAARAKGALITYDPNYRANLWPDRQAAIARMKEPLAFTDILKVSDEELPLLTGTENLEAGTRILADSGIRLVLVTLGPEGAFYRFGEKTGYVPGVPCQVGDTNGAGDTFFGAVLSKLCKKELDTLSVSELEEALAFANRAASLTTSRRGAIPAMPSLEEVEELSLR